jgi:hypothetical protein
VTKIAEIIAFECNSLYKKCGHISEKKVHIFKLEVAKKWAKKFISFLKVLDRLCREFLLLS